MNDIKVISIIGIGFMGTAIANWVSRFDYSLRLYDVSPEVQASLKLLAKRINRKKKKFGKQGDAVAHENILDTVKDADLVIEAIPEKLELKKKVFAEIDKAAPPKTIITTNSSSLPISKIEDAVERQDKVLNTHFYAPISHKPMVDIMRGTKTSDETFEKGMKWIESIECTPLVVKKECLGFVFNRIWRAIKKECLKIWAGGYADIETVDTAWKIFSGMGLGPFKMMDGVGLDVVYDIEMAYYNESGDLNDKPPQALKDKIDKGELGTKTEQGFYPIKK